MYQIIYNMSEKKLTKYERARILGVRAVQISMGATVNVDVTPDIENYPLEIARKELEEKKIPFIVRQYQPDGSYDDVHLKSKNKN